MRPSIRRIAAALGTTALLTTGTLALTAAPASAYEIALPGGGGAPRLCPPGYYGVAVYDRSGQPIAYACVRL